MAPLGYTDVVGLIVRTAFEGCCGGAPSTTTGPRTCAPRTGTGTGPRTGTRTTASAVRGVLAANMPPAARHAEPDRGARPNIPRLPVPVALPRPSGQAL